MTQKDFKDKLLKKVIDWFRLHNNLSKNQYVRFAESTIEEVSDDFSKKYKGKCINGRRHKYSDEKGERFDRCLICKELKH